jgi:glyceraldehyde-3-phosphate dehydrogenase (NADP+) (phosphorylating)
MPTPPSTHPTLFAAAVPTTTHQLTTKKQVEKKTFAEEVNNAFKEAANGPMKGVLAVCEEPLVSVDFR